jgi:hypothetical protein
MEPKKKVEPKTLSQDNGPVPLQDTELDEAELANVDGGTKKTGGSNSWYLAIAKALGEAMDKQANK